MEELALLIAYANSLRISLEGLRAQVSDLSDLEVLRNEPFWYKFRQANEALEDARNSVVRAVEELTALRKED